VEAAEAISFAGAERSRRSAGECGLRGVLIERSVRPVASRWGIEQAFADARQIVGVGEAAIGHAAPCSERCRSG
jgi:hypothetical protein